VAATPSSDALMISKHISFYLHFYIGLERWNNSRLPTS